MAIVIGPFENSVIFLKHFLKKKVVVGACIYNLFYYLFIY